ncbi:MAG: DNA recombination protein RmuC [Bacilli bacterium]
MEYIILGLLILIILFLIVVISMLFVKKNNNNDMTERLGRFELNITKEMNGFKDDLSKELNGDFSLLNEKIENRLNHINDRVNERLDQNFEKTNKTFTSVIERLSKIDEAQKKIESLSGDIVSLQSILTDKKSRGIYGEVNLNHILSNVFGAKNDTIYQLQVTLPNGTIADSVLYAPNPLGMICIDSKFPLENYRQMVDKKKSQAERDMYEKQFKLDIKKHIDAISNKYIIPELTADQAIMFLPAEAIFAELNAYHSDILDYAYKKRVWITSPTTLMSTLTVIQMLLKNMERDKYTSIIHEELNRLGIEFSRYKDRWERLSKSIQAVNRDVENVNITTEKITKKFDLINQVQVEKLGEENKNEIDTFIE